MPDTPRPRRLIVAVVLLAVLLGSAVLALLLRGGASPGRQGPSAAAPAGPTPTPHGTATKINAAAPPVAEQPLALAPAGVRWELFEGVALPISRTDGPTRIAGAVHAGFSRSPTGALLADAQIAGRSIIEPSLTGLWQIGQQQLADGPGKTAYLALVASFTDNNPPPAGYAQYAGFRYIAYSPDLAVISLATRSSSGAFQAGTDTMRWVAGDWQLELPASGLQQPQVVTDLTGYVPWSGVS